VRNIHRDRPRGTAVEETSGPRGSARRQSGVANRATWCGWDMYAFALPAQQAELGAGRATDVDHRPGPASVGNRHGCVARRRSSRADDTSQANGASPVQLTPRLPGGGSALGPSELKGDLNTDPWAFAHRPPAGRGLVAGEQHSAVRRPQLHVCGSGVGASPKHRPPVAATPAIRCRGPAGRPAALLLLLRATAAGSAEEPSSQQDENNPDNSDGLPGGDMPGGVFLGQAT
jgi:hypothetical protein